MAGTGMKDIKRRIKSVESTRQITKAMELVASSKMRRAKERAERTRPQFRLLYETISDIASRNRDLSSPYVKARPVRGSCVVVVAGDRGLAGGYNSNVFKAAQALMDTLKTLWWSLSGARRRSISISAASPFCSWTKSSPPRWNILG